MSDYQLTAMSKTLKCGCVLGYERCFDCRPGLHLDQETALEMTIEGLKQKRRSDLELS